MKWTALFFISITLIVDSIILPFRSQNGSYAKENKNTPFSNLLINHPYDDAIEFAVEKQWIVNEDYESFVPDDPIQKGKFIRILLNALPSTDTPMVFRENLQHFYSGYFESIEPIRYHEALNILLRNRGFYWELDVETDWMKACIDFAEKYRLYIPGNGHSSYDIEKWITHGEAIYLIRQTMTFHPFDGQFAANYANRYWEEGYIGIGKFHCYCSVRDAGDCANFVSQCILAGLVKSSDGGKVYESRLKFQDRTGKYVWWFDGSFDSDNDGEMDLFQNITASFETAWYQYQYCKNHAQISSDPDEAPQLIGMITEEIQRGGRPNVNRLQVGDIAFLRNEKTGETIHAMIVTEVPDHPTVHNVKINQRNITAKFCQYDISEGGCPFGEETVYERVNNHPDSDSWYVYRVLGFRTEDGAMNQQ